MQLIDSHCHLNYKDFEGEVLPFLERARQAGISGFLNICTDMAEADTIIQTAATYPDVFASVGVHPHDAEDGLESLTGDALTAWLVDKSQHPKVIGIGETGLDFHYDHSPRDLQKESFRAHIEAAIQLDLPLIVHTRAANEETIDIVKDYAGKARGVIHCFSETRWLAEEALKLGFYISISGIITFKKSQDLRDIVIDLPLDRLLVETDAPFLAPMPHRGKRNESAYMIETAQLLADLKGVTLSELAQVTTENFATLFSKTNLPTNL